MATTRTGKPVRIVPYDSRWPETFECECARIRALFPAGSVRIEHIGSTAVPGLAAKPIVDMLLGVEQLEDVVARIPALVQLGYEYVADHEDEFPDRRFFHRDADGERGQHLHAVEWTTDFWRDHLLFRDCLRADVEVARDYERIKIELATKFGCDRAGYTEAKTEFIEGVLRKARA